MKTVQERITDSMREVNKLKEEDPTLFLSVFFSISSTVIHVIAEGRQYPAEVRITLGFKDENDLLKNLRKAESPGWTAHERLTRLIKAATSVHYQPVC